MVRPTFGLFIIVQILIIILTQGYTHFKVGTFPQILMLIFIGMIFGFLITQLITCFYIEKNISKINKEGQSKM
jgi:hypothetical protein